MAPALTQRETELVSYAFMCLKDPDNAKVDFDKLAQLAGYKNPRSITNIWGPLKKKLFPADGEAPAMPSGSKAKGGKANGDAGDGDESTPSNPAAKKARSKGKGAANTEEAQDDDIGIKAEDNETGTQPDETAESQAPKATPKKRAPRAKATPEGEEGTGKKRARKPKDPNAESATPTKRAKKGSVVKQESPEAGAVEKGDDVADPIVPGETPFIDSLTNSNEDNTAAT